MNKALAISAAAALAFSGAAFAKGGSQKQSENAYISSDAQISAADCDTLSVASAKAACMRSVSAQGSAGASVGATTGSGSGMGVGGSASGHGSAHSQSGSSSGHGR